MWISELDYKHVEIFVEGQGFFTYWAHPEEEALQDELDLLRAENAKLRDLSFMLAEKRTTDLRWG